jgi:hypothetical protein
MGSPVRAGTRIVIQSHYINTSADPVLVRDVVNFETIPEDEVEVWAAPWGLGLTDMPLPPGEETTSTCECEWPEDVQILSMFGHMHERGTAMYMDHATEAGTERLYDVAAWDPEFRDTPPVIHHALPGLAVKAGDASTTSCAFFNSEDTELDFPYEMCAMTGMMYPSRTPMSCNPRQVR